MSDNKRISEMTTTPTLNGTDLFEIAQESAGTTSGYATFKTNLTAMANKIATGTQYAGLSTTAKDLVGAINEAAEGSTVEVTPILTEGTKIATITVDDTPADLYGENTKEEIRKMKTPKTVTGNPVTFETVEETFAKGAELTFGPIQDLHGYDSPWPGGAGKNKLQNVASTNTDNGITFTVNSDGTVTANGTATATAQFYINRVYNSNLAQNLAPYIGQSVIMNGCPSGGGSSTYRIIFARIDGENFYDETGTGQSATVADLTSVNAYVRIQIENGVTVNNLTFKPMIRLATETDASFAPYENNCPISGRNSVSLTVGGENIAPRTATQTFSSTEYGATGSIKDGDWERTMRLVDLGDLNWVVSNSIFSITKSEIGMKSGTREAIQFISDIYPRGASGTDHAMYQTTSFFRILDTNYTDLATFKAAMAGHQLCYDLETPEAITGTAHDILLNAGTNNVSTDADTAAVTYTEMTTLDDMRILINAAQTA